MLHVNCLFINHIYLMYICISEKVDKPKHWQWNQKWYFIFIFESVVSVLVYPLFHFFFSHLVRFIKSAISPYLYKQNLALNNIQELICHKTHQTNSEEQSSYSGWSSLWLLHMVFGKGMNLILTNRSNQKLLYFWYYEAHYKLSHW